MVVCFGKAQRKHLREHLQARMDLLEVKQVAMPLLLWSNPLSHSVAET